MKPIMYPKPKCPMCGGHGVYEGCRCVCVAHAVAGMGGAERVTYAESGQVVCWKRRADGEWVPQLRIVSE